MAKEYVEFAEVVEMFLYCTVRDIRSESEIPNLNFLFTDKAFELFDYVKKNPFTKEGCYIPNITDEDIERVKRQDENSPTIVVKDPISFFNYLKDITNAIVAGKARQGNLFSGRSIFIDYIKRIWLRMGPSDFFNVEEFLKKQLDFLNSSVFDNYRKIKSVGIYENYSIRAKKVDARSWSEASKKFEFSLFEDEQEVYTLPSIYFGIREENGTMVCYIYAIQNESHKKIDKKALRSLYKLNEGIDNPNVHPSAVLALITFLKMLEEQGIFKVKVSLLQVLSYRFHEILGKKEKESFENKWGNMSLDTIEGQERLREYEVDLEWYKHTVDKQDFIEKAKTEGLINMFLRVQEQFPFVEILTDPFIEDEYLNVYLNPDEKRKR